mgnify:CR=1 FL=1
MWNITALANTVQKLLTVIVSDKITEWQTGQNQSGVGGGAENTQNINN